MDPVMEQAVQELFRQYQRFFMQALAGQPDPAAIARLYTPEFIAASAAGVTTGKQDADFMQAMAQGYDYYRDIGTRDMQISAIRISPIDPTHCIAHIGWQARYARDDLPETVIAFDVHYLVQYLDGIARVFGWITGDEQATLRENGVI